MPHRHQGILGQLLVAQQQAIDLRARLDREHRAGEGFLRFGERAIEASTLEAFFEIAAEEVVVTFDTESALVLRIEAGRAELVAHCCAEGITGAEIAAIGEHVQGLSSGRAAIRREGLPTLAGNALVLLLAAAYADGNDGSGTYVLVGMVSAAKAAFYPSFDEGFASLFAAFANHASALQQHLRSRLEGRRVAKQMKRLADVASRTSNAVVITDRHGTIEWVNDSFVRLTGYSLEEAVGRRPGALLQGPGTDPAVRAKIGAAVARFEPFDVELLNYRKDGRQYYVQIQTRVTYDERGEPTGFVAIETDITQRRIAERREGLAQRVAGMLLRSDTMERASERLVQELVAELDVPIAQMWAAAPGQPTLNYLAGAAAAGTGEAGPALLALTRSIDFHPGPDSTRGVGLPGKAWFTGAPALNTDLLAPTPSEARSRRAAAADAAGVHAFCAVPVQGPGGVLGVIEVGTPRGHPFNEVLPTLLDRVAEHFAAFVLRDLTRRNFRTMFEHSPDALLLVGESGRVEAVNVRARALFGEPADRRVETVLEGGLALVHSVLRTEAGVGANTSLVHHTAFRDDGTPFSAEVSVSAVTTATGRAALLSLRDLTERLRMEQQLTESLREKETLLKEIHHRVKNNLQVISGLLSLQSEQMPSERAKDLLLESVHRVRSMALIHEHLYGNDSLRRIDLAAYARRLTDSLRGALAPSVALRLDAEAVELSIEHAVPVGLILNELVTNALKYGLPKEPRPAGREADVWVRLRRESDRCVLEVQDFGAGLPAGFDLRKTTSLGLHLVRSLTRQLRGTVSSTSAGGLSWRIDFPIDTGAVHVDTIAPPAAAR